jgi:hypothetical protein
MVSGVRSEARRIAEVKTRVRDHFFQIALGNRIVHELLDLTHDGRGLFDP